MRRVPLLVLSCSILSSLAGCATVLHTRDRVIRVTSFPEGATVLLDGQATGRTPCFVTVPYSCEGILTFELAGHESVVVPIRHVVNGKTWMNLFWIPAVLPGAIVVHAADGDATWRDDLAIAGGTAAAAMVISFVVDARTGNSTRHSADPIHVTLRRTGSR